MRRLALRYGALLLQCLLLPLAYRPSATASLVAASIETATDFPVLVLRTLLFLFLGNMASFCIALR